MSKKQTYVITPEFRVSFPVVFEPKSYRGKGQEKFSINMLFPKSTDITELKNMCKSWALSKWGEDGIKGVKWPFKDGDVKGKQDGYEMYKDTVWCVATSVHKPQIVQPDAETYITEAAVFYPGCYARCEVHAFDYENEGRGISIGLGNLQKTKDGEKFAGRPSAKDQFDAVETGADDPANFDDEDDMVDSAPPETIEL